MLLSSLRLLTNSRLDKMSVLICLMILYVPSTIFQLNRDGSSWVEPVLSWDKCVLLKDYNAVTLVRLEPAAPRSRVKHSTTNRIFWKSYLSCIEFTNTYSIYTKCIWLGKWDSLTSGLKLQVIPRHLIKFLKRICSNFSIRLLRSEDVPNLGLKW